MMNYTSEVLKALLGFHADHVAAGLTADPHNNTTFWKSGEELS